VSFREELAESIAIEAVLASLLVTAIFGSAVVVPTAMPQGWLSALSSGWAF
jgi:hypothetical protein